MINRTKNYLFVLLGLSIPISISLTYIILFLLLALFVLDRDYQKIKFLKTEKWSLPLLLIFVLYILGSVYGQFSLDTKEVFKRFSVWLFLPILFLMDLKQESYSKGIFAFLTSVFLMVIMSILNQLGFIAHIFEYFPSLFKNSNPLALYPSTHLYNYHNILVSFSLIICFYLTKKLARPKIYLLISFIILLIFSLFSEAGRAGQIVFILFLTLYSIDLAIKKKKESIYMIFFLIVTLLISYNYSPNFNYRVNELVLKFQSAEKNNDFRYNFWKSTLNKICENPAKNLMGHGTGSWRSEMNDSFDYFNLVDENHTTPHNNYLYIFFEIGVLGFIALSYFFYAMYCKLKTKAHEFFSRNLVVSYTALMLFDSYMLIFIISIAYIYLFTISVNYE
ncbi:O-antigen ligase family protein [Bacteroidota bacterium]|nr:O-antigen ligase family protein [Bacteroidota bacterium]